MQASWEELSFLLKRILDGALRLRLRRVASPVEGHHGETRGERSWIGSTSVFGVSGIRLRAREKLAERVIFTRGRTNFRIRNPRYIVSVFVAEGRQGKSAK